METMKAYRWHGPGSRALKLEDIAVPDPGPGEVLLRVKACGLCHSDCHILDGSQSASVKLRPITLGHEVAGEVTKVGAGVSNANINDRVNVSLGGFPDRPPKVIGLTMHGGYAEYAIAAADMIMKIPDAVSFEQAAVLTDCMVTSYSAVVTTGEIKSGQTVAVVGLGGLGSTGLRLACLQGATVYGFDIDARRFPSALEAGARACYEKLEDVPDIRFDTVIDFVGISQTINSAVKALRYRGRLVWVGLGGTAVNIRAFDVVFNRIELRGCLGGSKEDALALMELIAEGKLEPELLEVPFHDVNASLTRLASGEVLGRMYTRPSAT